jgi:hypothetical protein
MSERKTETLADHIVKSRIQPIEKPSATDNVKQPITTQKTFTTEPKIPKKHGNWRSIENCKAFMYELFRKNLRKCSYDTLVFEFINFFGTNDTRTVERYLGRPERIGKDAASTKIIRMNRISGKIAQFDYFNERRIRAKKGLLDILGWILKLKDDTVLINHEVMSYYTKQTSLQELESSHKNDESREVSKAKMCVSNLLGGENELEVSERDSIEVEREKKEVIDSAHTCRIGADYASKHTQYALTPEESAILNAVPCEEPDRGKVTYRVRGHESEGEKLK